MLASRQAAEDALSHLAIHNGSLVQVEIRTRSTTEVEVEVSWYFPLLVIQVHRSGRMAVVCGELRLQMGPMGRFYLPAQSF